MISEPQVLIGIAGKASAGKDSVAGLLRTFGFVVLNSADLISA
jgi:dephospho-CoA kinase